MTPLCVYVCGAFQGEYNAAYNLQSFPLRTVKNFLYSA